MSDTTGAVITNRLGGNSQVGTSVQAGSIQTVHFHAEARLPPPTPRQLRPVPVTFTDRVPDLKALTGRLAEQPPFAVGIVVVSGVGGVGKTALANRLLHQVSGQFPGGQLYADLRGYTLGGPACTGEVLGRLLRSFRHGPLPADVEELAGWWRSITAEHRERRIAMLLDNAISVEQVRALLPGGAGHLVVVTSREQLPGLARDGAVFHPLGPLEQSAAVELLTRCIGADRVGREQQAAGQLAALSGGLPLAVTVTGAQMATSPGRPITDVLASLLSSRPQALTGQPEYDRGRTAMSTALEPAYFALDRETASVYRRLGFLFTADFDPDLTAAACAITPEAGCDALTALAFAQLLEDRGHHDGRGQVYGFHDTVRRHALGRAQREETDGAGQETIRRALDFLLAAATAAERRLTPNHRVLARDYTFPPAHALSFDTDGAALAWLDAQHSNLMAAIRTAYGARLHGTAWQITHAMWPWWHRFQHYGLWFEAHQIAHACAGMAHDAAAEREILNTWGIGYRGAGRYDDAVDCFTRVLDMARRDRDQASESQALHELGSAHHATGRSTQAQTFLLQARQLREAIGYRRGVALTDICLGLVALDAGRVREAVGCFTTARTALLAEHDQFDAARALAWTGRGHALLGDFTTATRLLRQAHTEFQEAGSPRWIARSLEMLGETAEDQDHHEDAAQLYTQALAVYEPISMRDTQRPQGRLRALAPATNAPHGGNPTPAPPS